MGKRDCAYEQPFSIFKKEWSQMAKQQKQVKTNAIRFVEQAKVPFSVIQYATDDQLLDGVSVAEKTGQRVETVFKTLVTRATDQSIHIFIIPVAEELHMKKAAKVANVKKLDLLPLRQLTKETGYVRGGCSPIGMKKQYPTYLDESAKQLDEIVVSAGKPGLQMKIAPSHLLSLTEGVYASLCTDA